MRDYFKYTEAELYERALAQGNTRFGSDCKHERVVNGKCARCFRKVVTRER